MFASTYRRCMPALVLVAVLSGCAGQQTTAGGLTPQTAGPASLPLSDKLAQPGATHPNHSKSWMMPGAVSQKLLYISDPGAAVVNVYTYPGLTYAGQLTGFSNPGGECTDRTGNVWITDQAAAVYEYAHGGTSPINVLSTGNQAALGCAINLKTGDLAVSDGGSPQVWIYHNAAGTPTAYVDTNFSQTAFLGYDDQGNLFVDGSGNSNAFHYAELPAGSSTFTDITLNGGGPTLPGNVQWDGTYMAVGDRASHIYRTQGSNVVSTTTLSTTQLGQFYILPSKVKVIAPDPASANVDTYAYPAGGSPIKAVTGGLNLPVGAVLSR